MVSSIESELQQRTLNISRRNVIWESIIIDVITKSPFVISESCVLSTLNTFHPLSAKLHPGCCDGSGSTVSLGLIPVFFPIEKMPWTFNPILAFPQ